jgi:hypothetical protein
MIPLIQGVYDIRTWVGGLAGETSDEIETAFELTVIENDVFGTGKRLAEGGNIFFVEHSWKFSKGGVGQ